MTKNKREGIGKRLRFEVLKRDGFRCRYCGATPDQQVLHIDHIIPVVEGGTNDPINLVAACQPCNSGKAHKRLDSQPIPTPPVPTKRQLAEQRKQVEAYIAAQKEADERQQAVADFYCEQWEIHIGPMNEGAASRIRNLISIVPHTLVSDALWVTARSKVATPGAPFDSYTAVQQLKYFNAVLRNMREGREWRKW